ncbi:hypothetical protein A9Q99_17790 [Gammaproteobacteria bacterium 45_16_T64]|nr:hypothetical protein A9Q99_17790 [Gammaproteobacteria bacterium 45_16_T64]
MRTLILPSEALGSISLLNDESDRERKIQETSKDQNFHCFMVGKIGALIDETQYCEIIDVNNICRIPLTPHWFKGIVNLRGNSVPIISLDNYYGDTTATSKKSHIIAIGKGKNICGIKIDNLPHKTTLHEDDIINRAISLPTHMNHHIDSVYEKDGLWVHLNIEKLCTHVFSQVNQHTN